MNMNKQLLRMTSICVLGLAMQGCTCDIDSSEYDQVLSYSISTNRVDVGTPIDISFSIPDMAEEIFSGMTNDISDLDFSEMALHLSSFSSDDQLSYWQFEDAKEKFEVESENTLTSTDPLSEFIRVSLDDNSFSVRITPLEADTFIVRVGVAVAREGRGTLTCGPPVHTIRPINEALPIDASGIGISSDQSFLLEGEQTNGLLVLVVN